MAITRRKGVKGSFLVLFCDKTTTMRIFPIRPKMVTMTKLMTIESCASMTGEAVDEEFQSLDVDTFELFEETLQGDAVEEKSKSIVDERFQSMVGNDGEVFVGDDIVNAMVKGQSLTKLQIAGTVNGSQTL